MRVVVFVLCRGRHLRWCRLILGVIKALGTERGQRCPMLWHFVRTVCYDGGSSFQGGKLCLSLADLRESPFICTFATTNSIISHISTSPTQSTRRRLESMRVLAVRASELTKLVSIRVSGCGGTVGGIAAAQADEGAGRLAGASRRGGLCGMESRGTRRGIRQNRAATLTKGARRV